MQSGFRQNPVSLSLGMEGRKNNRNIQLEREEKGLSLSSLFLANREIGTQLASLWGKTKNSESTSDRATDSNKELFSSEDRKEIALPCLRQIYAPSKI